MKAWIRFVLERPLLTLTLATLVCLGLGLGAARVRIDNGASVWLPTRDAELASFARFRERFGEDGFLIAATARVSVTDPATLTALAGTRDALAALPGVEHVLSPLAHEGRRAELEADSELLSAALQQLPEERVGPGLRQLSTQLGVLRGLARLQPAIDSPELSERALARVLASDEHLALLVAPRPDLSPSARAALVAEVEAELRTTGAGLGPWDLAGTDVVTRDLDRGSQRSFGALFPLVLALMGVVLLAVLRSWRCVAAIAGAAGLASASTIGLMGWLGHTLNLLLVVVPAILAVTTTAYALHLVTRYLRQDALSPGQPAPRAERVERWRRAIEGTFGPCLLTALTTAAGFASLGLSRLPPVRDLGLFTAFGVLMAFVLVFTFVPALLLRSPRVLPRALEERAWTPARAARFTNWLFLRRRAIACAGLLAAALGAIGLGRLSLESHVLSFFPDGHPLPASYERIGDEFFGLTSLELWLEGPREALYSTDSMIALDRFLEQAQAEPLLAESPIIWPLAGPLAELAPAERGALLGSLALSEAAPDDPAQRFLWSDGERAALRATLPARTSSSNAVHRLVVRLKEALSSAGFPAPIEARITGSAPLLVRGQVLLLETQLSSFALALAVVTLVLWLAFRSARLVAVSLIPNVLPIVLVLGFMGLAGIPLNSATVTVAGIALGLIVDDTIHFLHAWQAARGGAGLGARAAIARTLAEVGPPIVTTSVALALGFSGLAFSSFRPTFYFGVLIALTGVAALVCDLVLLPAALLLRAEWSGNQGTAVEPSAIRPQ